MSSLFIFVEYVAFESKFNWSNQKNKENNWSTSKSTPNLAETANKQKYQEMAHRSDLQHSSKIDEHMRSVGCELNRESVKTDKHEVDGFHSSNMYKSCKSIDIFTDDNRHSAKLKEPRKHIVSDYDSRISEKENHQIFTFESNTSTTNSATNHSGISNGSEHLILDREGNTKKNGFYVRALFEFDPDVEKNLPSRPLAFLTNDIILVVNSADNDWWQVGFCGFVLYFVQIFIIGYGYYIIGMWETFAFKRRSRILRNEFLVEIFVFLK